MSGFLKVGRVNMTEGEVCELLCNSEDIAYDSTDCSDSDIDNLEDTIPLEKVCRKKVTPLGETNMQVIVDENDTDDETVDEIDLNTSVHDSFLKMINDDNYEGSPTNVDLGELETLDFGPSTSSAAKRNNSVSFASQFREVKIDPKSSEFERVLWKKGNLQFNEEQVRFSGDSSLSENIQNLETPYQVWSYLFPQSLEEHIVEETLKYAGIDNAFTFNVFDLRKFIGILFYMTYYKLPNSRDYWSQNSHRCVDVIKAQMNRRRFEKIREVLHFNDKDKQPARDDQNRDRLYLIRPVIDTLNKTFGSIPKLDRLCVDEQMCSTKIGSYMKQYLPNKPKKWGFKFYVMCDTTGYAYKFELYSGSINIPTVLEPDLQSSANIVIRLLREVPRFQNYIVYFDNFYTTVPLLVYLRTQGILAVGTIRRNRIKNCKLPDEKLMMKYERGTSQEFISNIYGVDVTSLSWKDNRIVNLVSTYVGTKPISDTNNSETQPLTVKRFDKKDKSVKNIPCPQIIKDYNRHMGGVDLMDSSMGRHKIMMKSRKWTNRVFYHLLDMTCINAWLLYKRINKGRPGFKELRLVDFKLEVADALFSFNTKAAPERGRPSLEKQILEKRRRPNAQPIPPTDTRLDLTDHWTTMDKKGRCKMPNCTGQTRMFCTKCKINLCITSDKNCFFDYHHN